MEFPSNPLPLRVAIFVTGVLLSSATALATPLASIPSASSVGDMTPAVTLMSQGKMKEADAIFQKLL
jgi:hypothetical protein